MRYLSLPETLELHRRVIELTAGGSSASFTRIQPCDSRIRPSHARIHVSRPRIRV
jgi:hypothetical protein